MNPIRILVALVVVCILTSCIAFPTQTPPTPTPTLEPGEVGELFRFTGKVVKSEAGEWLNDRLVVLYLKGMEVGRVTTGVGENNLSGEGVTDGFFQIEVENTYKIPENRIDFSSFADGTYEMDYEVTGFLSGYDFLNSWLGEIDEGSLISIPVPSKNVKYDIKVFASDVSALPPEMLIAGSTSLTQDNQVVLSLGKSDNSESARRVLIQGLKYDVDEETVEQNKITVPIDNCGGSSSVSQEYKYTQTFYHEYQADARAGLDVSLPIPVGWPQILVELQTKYGFQQGQIDTQEITHKMEVAAGDNVMYIVTWKEVWETGVAVVEAGNEVINVPFRVRTNVIYEVTSRKFDCP